MKQAWKLNRRARPKYDRKSGTREGGAVVFRSYPKLRPIGSRPCGCGRTISANKDSCKGCSK